jgi:hypothetical protein
MIARVGTFRGRRVQRPWYVDSVNGNDNNKGKAPGDALRTIAAVVPKIKPGDVVALVRGSHWREEFVVPADKVEVVAYGNGPKPLLDCSDPVVASPWDAYVPGFAVPSSFAEWQSYLLDNPAITASGTSPDGVSVAYKIRESGDNPAQHFASALVTIPAGTQRFTVFLKAAERSWAWVGWWDNGGSTWRYQYVNLEAGVLGSADAGISSTITDAGDGWYRVDMTFEVTTAGAALGVGPCGQNASPTDWNSVAGAGIYAWYPATAVWTKTAGRAAVYHATVTLDWAADQTFVGCWEDGARLVRAQSVADCDAKPGSFFPSDENTSPITLYVHPSDGLSPAVNGKLYEYSKRKHGLKNAHVARGIWTRRNSHATGSLVCGAYTYDCLAGEGNVHNVFLWKGAYLENVEAAENYRPGAGFGSSTMFVLYSDTGDNADATLVNCFAHRTKLNADDDTSCVGIYCHTAGANNFGTLTLRNCRAEGDLYVGIGTANVSHLRIEGGSTTGTMWGVQPGVSSTVGINGFIGSALGIVMHLGGCTGAAVTIEGCDLSSSGWGTACIMYGGSPMTITGTTFRGGGTFALYGGGTDLRVDHCVFHNDGYHYYYFPAGQPTFSDYNTFTTVSGNGGRMFHVNGVDYTYSEYRALTGQDLHSTP